VNSLPDSFQQEERYLAEETKKKERERRKFHHVLPVCLFSLIQ
jgi:hypothetical protein